MKAPLGTAQAAPHRKGRSVAISTSEADRQSSSHQSASGTRPGRAVRFDEYGSVDVLHLAAVDMPPPGRDEVLVLVLVRATGINPEEAGIRRGALHDHFPATFPSGEGSDLAGVRAVGAGNGDVVAVSAASGGVGTVLVQLLQVRGARGLGIASDGAAPLLRDHGVEPIRYGEGVLDRVRAVAPNGVDAFIDLRAPEHVQLAVDLGVIPQRIDTVVPPSWPLAQQIGAKTEGKHGGHVTAGPGRDGRPRRRRPHRPADRGHVPPRPRP
jgi:hypothetical protein